MTDSATLAHVRRQVILRAQELGNVSRACSEFRISHTTYYNWLDRWLRYGPEGLRPVRADGEQRRRGSEVAWAGLLPALRAARLSPTDELRTV